MSLLEIECPACHEVLEVDRGFAGGVCRCSHCGALMSVPSRHAQPIQRAARPEAPGGARRAARPEAPGGARRPAQPSAPAASGRPAAPQATPERPPSPAASQAPVQEAPSEVDAPLQTEQVTEVSSSTSGLAFQTDSGEVIHLEKGAKVPVAEMKRKAARWATRAVLGGLTALIVLLGIGAIVFVMNQPKNSGIAQVDYREDFMYDDNANPYTLADPNALGLPLGNKTIIVAEASKRSEAALPLIQQALSKGLPRPGSTARVGLIYAHGGDVSMLPEPFNSLNSLTSKELGKLDRNVSATGSAESIAKAFAQACEHKPLKVIVITSGDIGRETLNAMYEQVDAMPTLRVDAAVVGGDDPGLEAMTRETGGVYCNLQLDDLKDWSSQAD